MTIKKQIGFFEKYLTFWVLLCIAAGILIGKTANAHILALSDCNLSGINIPVAILIWLMIYPMMVQIDFRSIKKAGKKPKGLLLTLTINWLLKPFSMAFFAWIFFDHIYAGILSAVQAKEYIAGAILLGAAPCTAMVFVWSYLSDGDPVYTLIQVSVNDLVLLFAYIPITGLLLGMSNIRIPYGTLFTSVAVFVCIPLFAGYISRVWLLSTKGEQWFKTHFLPQLKPVSIAALLTTLILLFAFQGEHILFNPLLIVLLAIPLTLQTYFIFFVSWYSGKALGLPHAILAPASMIGASNFFELSVAVAIALFGLNSGAALTTVVGVLTEVPVMLSLVSIAGKLKKQQPVR